MSDEPKDGRTVRLNVRVSPEERDEIKLRAMRLRKDVSTYVREVLNLSRPGGVHPAEEGAEEEGE